MTEALEELLEAAKRAPPSEEQRRSFVFGNTAFENELITRKMVDDQADKMNKRLENDGRI